METYIKDKHNFTLRENSIKLVYVRLKASVEQYSVDTDKGVFNLR